MKWLFGILVVLFLFGSSKTNAQYMANPEELDRKVRALNAANDKRSAETSRLNKEALAFIKKQQYSKALPLMLQSIKVNPNHGVTIELLVTCYVGLKRPGDVIDVLKPLVYTLPNAVNPYGFETQTRMIYVLALLDTGNWEEAASVYEQWIKTPPRWAVPCYGVGNGGKEHTVPDVHFDPNISNVPGLRAQAHLILGTRAPYLGNILSSEECEVYMLDHLQQALQSDRRCLDAQFLSGVILNDLNRFDEARVAFAKALKLAPRETKPEIETAIASMNTRETTYKAFLAAKAARTTENQDKAH